MMILSAWWRRGRLFTDACGDLAADGRRQICAAGPSQNAGHRLRGSRQPRRGWAAVTQGALLRVVATGQRSTTILRIACGAARGAILVTGFVAVTVIRMPLQLMHEPALLQPGQDSPGG
jgi:hypothetical protein